MHSPKVSLVYSVNHMAGINVPLYQAFRAEKASWRAVIQLNVVQSIHAILDLISKAHAASNGASSTASISSGHASTSSSSPPSSPTVTTPKEYPPLTSDHLKLKMRLAPLTQVEAALIRRLLPPDQVEGLSRSNLTAPPFHQEISVNSSAAWKNAFNRLIRNSGGRDSCDSIDLNWSDPQDPGVVLHACSDDMVKLWVDPTVRKLMEIEKMRPEEMAGL